MACGWRAEVGGSRFIKSYSHGEAIHPCFTKRRPTAPGAFRRGAAWRARLRGGGGPWPGRWSDGEPILLRGELARLSIAIDGDFRTVAYGDRTITMPVASDDASSIQADLRALVREEIVPRLHEP